MIDIDEMERLVRLGFEIAEDNIEISEDDGWRRVAPFLETKLARACLEKKIAELRTAAKSS